MSPLNLCLAGASGDSSNLGVQALRCSVLAGLGRIPDIESLVVFDDGWGVHSVANPYGGYRLERCGVRLSRRWYRSESWQNIAISARLGGLGNPVVRRLRGATAVLDISGGDSFSDIYGKRRFHAVLAPKRAALAMCRPLVLLPQTYGPFASADVWAAARDMVRGAFVAYSRDDASHEVLLDLLGEHADPKRHRRGVDVAFALDPAEPSAGLSEPLRADLTRVGNGHARVGLNISGLIYNDPQARERFGLSVDYRAVVRKILMWFVDQDCDVFLVPHVFGGRGANGHDDDLRVCHHVLAELEPTAASRVRVLPAGLSAAEAKWFISRMDWFCGTRMHSTVAALSSGVPTAALAYSMKTRGVFETCGQGAEVIDARSTSNDECVYRLQDAWHRRASVRKAIRARIGAVHDLASGQLAEMINLVRAQQEIV
jgi:colanic acid/amylovoran biosynthesis protein WcaK/AmsJ